MDEFLAKLIPQLIPVVLAIVGLVFIRIEKYIRTKVTNEKAELAFLGVNDIVRTVVAEVGQTVVADIKTKAQDGKLTKEEALDSKNKAVAKVKELLPDKTEKLLGSMVADLDKYIQSKIEEEVAASK